MASLPVPCPSCRSPLSPEPSVHPRQLLRVTFLLHFLCALSSAEVTHLYPLSLHLLQEATQSLRAAPLPHLSLWVPVDPCRPHPPGAGCPVMNGGHGGFPKAGLCPAGILFAWAPRPPLPGSPRASPCCLGRRVSTPDAGTEPGEHVARASPRQGLADGLRGLQTWPWGRQVPVF